MFMVRGLTCWLAKHKLICFRYKVMVVIPTRVLFSTVNRLNTRVSAIIISSRLLDCGIISSRVQLNLDDLLWVLTDSQLKAAILFANSLRDIIKKSNAQSKLQAAEKLQVGGDVALSPIF